MLSKPLFCQFPWDIILSPRICHLTCVFWVSQSAALLGFPIGSSLCRSSFVSELVSRAAAQVRPEPECCGRVWGGASSTSFSLFDRVQRKAFGWSTIPHLQSLALNHAIDSLFPFYRYYFDFCSSEFAPAVPLPVTFSVVTSKWLINPTEFLLLGVVLLSFFRHPTSLELQTCGTLPQSFIRQKQNQ